MGIFRKALLGTAIAALAMSPLVTTVAKANPIYIGYSLTNGGPITEFTGALGNSGNNNIASTASSGVTVGSFTIQLSGSDIPIASTPGVQLFSNTITVNSDGVSSLFLYVSETNNALPAVSFTTGFASNSQSSPATVTESTYASSTNTRFAMTNLLSSRVVTPGALDSNATAPAPAGLTTPFSVTEMYQLDFTTSGRINTTLSLTQTVAAVPEPASMALLGAGLVGVGVFRRRRAK